MTVVISDCERPRALRRERRGLALTDVGDVVLGYAKQILVVNELLYKAQLEPPQAMAALTRNPD